MYRHFLQRLYQIEEKLKLNQIQEAAKDFVVFIKVYTRDKEEDHLEVFDKLLAIDSFFKSSKHRNEFLEPIKKYVLSEDSIHMPKDLKIFITEILYLPYDKHDPFRIQQLAFISDPSFIFDYLLTMSETKKALYDKDLKKINELLTYFKDLVPRIPHNQIMYFSDERGKIFYSYLELLPAEEIIVEIEQELKEGWIIQASYMRNILITRKDFLCDALKIKTQLTDNFENSSKKYAQDHITILGCFTGIAALIFIGSQLTLASIGIYEKLTSLFGLCICICTLFSLLLTVIHSKRYFWLVAAFLILLGILTYINYEDSLLRSQKSHTA